MLKKCSKCKKEKNTEEFYSNKGWTKDGFHVWCKKCVIEGKKKVYYQMTEGEKEKRKAYRRNWRKLHKNYIQNAHKKSYEKLRLEVLNYYSNNDIKCNCCGEKIYEFLALDHINGDGNKHRKLIGRGGLYQWIRNNKYPQGFQILCHNCNFAKGHYGKCPHSEKKG